MLTHKPTGGQAPLWTYIILLSSLNSGGNMMSQKIVVESTNPKDTPADIEDKLEKAVNSIRLQRENKQFSDLYLRQRKDESTTLVKKVFSNMFDEIAEVLQQGK